MKRNLNLWIGCLGIVFLLASCAPTVHVEKDENADFAKYKTFAWLEKKTENKEDSRNDLAEQKIRDAVTAELIKMTGWQESKSNPDVLLCYDLLVERSTRQESNPVYSNPFSRIFYNPYSDRFFRVYYPSRFVGYDNFNVSIREGTVTISMIDANTEKTVWQGWTTDEVGRHITSEEIENSVEAIFGKFNVAKA